MPLLNYTTTVNVYKTLGEIQIQLVKHGAKKIMQDYDDAGHIAALSFLVDTPTGPRGIRLPGPGGAGCVEDPERLGRSSDGNSRERDGSETDRPFLRHTAVINCFWRDKKWEPC